METDELGEMIVEALQEEFSGLRIMPFADAGVMTCDCGLVITASDGTQFQVTIVRSRKGK